MEIPNLMEILSFYMCEAVGTPSQMSDWQSASNEAEERKRTALFTRFCQAGVLGSQQQNKETCLCNSP